MWKEVTRIITDRYPYLDKDTLRYQCIRALIDTFIRDLIQETEAILERMGFDSPKALACAEKPVVDFSPKMKAWKRELNEFLHSRFYTHHRILRMQFKAYRLLRDLFQEYVERPSQLPPGVQKRIKHGKEPPERIVCDYIAGMTDRFALDEHRKLFLPYEY